MDEFPGSPGASEEVLRVLADRTQALEEAQRQILAFRLQATLSSAYTADLEQSLAAALTRADRAEHECRMLRLINDESFAAVAAGAALNEDLIRAEVGRLLTNAVSMMRP